MYVNKISIKSQPSMLTHKMCVFYQVQIEVKVYQTENFEMSCLTFSLIDVEYYEKTKLWFPPNDFDLMSLRWIQTKHMVLV